MRRPRLLRALRSLVLRRVVALALVAGMAGWAAAPVASADPAQAAQLARAHAAGPIEAALADALDAAVRAPEAADAFAEALLASLDAHPDGEALARFVRDFDGTQSDLLDLLVGHLIQARGVASPHPLSFVAGGAVLSLSASAPLAASAAPAPSSVSVVEPAGSVRAHDVERRVVPVALRSSAQPLGP